MKPSFRNSIGIRFLRIVFGCYLFITVTVTSAQLYVEYAEIEKEVVTELANIASSFEDGLGKALWNLDNDSIEFILAGITKIEVISGVKVMGLNDDLQAAAGVYLSRRDNYTQIDSLAFDELKARVLTTNGQKVGSFYEYTLTIIFEGTLDNAPEPVGYISLYAGHDTVVQRFKYSFILILVIAAIKTIALWLIFLYFARRVVAKPISELATATQALSKSDKQSLNSETLSPLETIANSDHHDEIQMLAKDFLEMQKTVLERLKNLYGLNDLAINLSKANTTEQVFSDISELITTNFGSNFAVVVEKKGVVSWSSIPREQLPALLIETLKNESEQLKPTHYNRTITYVHESALFTPLEAGRALRSMASEASEDGIGLHEYTPAATTSEPILILPLLAEGFDGKQLRFFGLLNNDRLTADCNLTKETRSFLQLVTGMVCNTLTNLHQREVIEEQNNFLEHRVEERTRELAQVNAELKHLAVHDPLTQLPNRTLFNDRLEQLIYLATREKRTFAIASIDLSKFKFINDNYGHDAGDAVLIEIGKRFSKVLRNTDTLARMGGDEFAAILTNTSREDAIDKVMQELIATLDEPVVLEDNAHIMAGANIGIALYPVHATTSDQLFKFADIAMYQAKRENSGYAIFSAEKNTREKEVVQLMNELELAITREQLVLHYQPIIDISTGQIRGFEALVRWVHPTKGKIPPNMFIPHAEKSRHITPLTHWVLRTACAQCAYFKSLGLDLPISINLSPRVFTSPDLPEKVNTLLEEYQLDANWIKLEITENAAMTNPDQAMEIVSKFKEMGSPISIDDFGTGHSSLAYLTQLPLNELKIDKSFLTSDSPSNRLVVQTIIELAHALGLKVVAEGIETKETYDMLREKGCDYAQGYFLGHPIEAEKILPLLEQYQENSPLMSHA